MKSNPFFITSKLFKELMILDAVSKSEKITQREMALAANVSTSMINEYIEKYENEGSIERNYLSSKTVEYNITPKGEEKRKYLYIQYLEASLDVFNTAKVECELFLKSIVDKGYKNILFYGAGEVAEIMLYVIKSSDNIDINVQAIIDDDVNKQGNRLAGKSVIDMSKLINYTYDGILISSYTNNNSMKEKLIRNGFSESKIIEFFK